MVLYMVERGHHAFFSTLRSNKLCALYELWHARLGHVTYKTIALLYKNGSLSLTSLLPKPIVCTGCQLGKSHRLPFTLNENHHSTILGLVHCDL